MAKARVSFALLWKIKDIKTIEIDDRTINAIMIEGIKERAIHLNLLKNTDSASMFNILTVANLVAARTEENQAA